jgi:hypothetical protein
MKQAPLPIVSGRYFFPKAPELCLKWMPAWAVMSVRVIGPEGRGAVATGLSSGTADFGAGADGVIGTGLATGCGTDSTFGEGFCLQAVVHKSAASNRQ